MPRENAWLCVPRIIALSVCCCIARSKISNGDFTIADEDLKLGTTGPWVERDLYRAIPAVTQDLEFCALIRGSAVI